MQVLKCWGYHLGDFHFPYFVTTAKIPSSRKWSKVFTIGEAAWSTCGVSGKEEDEEGMREGVREGHFKKIILYNYNFCFPGFNMWCFG